MIVGTAGHIDHGKTALVKALTGIDTDRLEEEKRRGITLELGFAHLEVAAGRSIGFVDVPGHERFLGAMVAGAGGFDWVLLVVAADEGVMPQTKEHLEVCQLLGIRRGLLVVTKSDLLPGIGTEGAALLKADLGELTARTFLEGAPVFFCSAVTGEGIGELQAELVRQAQSSAPLLSDGPVFLPVDRAFTLKGFGTVVTGTLLSGRLSEGGLVSLLPGQPGPFRVRGLQIHGRPTKEASAPTRLAVNLAGVEAGQLSRGLVLSKEGELPQGRMLDVDLRLLESAPKAIARRRRWLLHLGCAQVEATSHLIGQDELLPGESCLAQLRLGRDVAPLVGQSFVLRGFGTEAGRGRLLAGGRVLNLSRTRRRARDLEGLRPLLGTQPEDRVAFVLREAGYRGLTESELVGRTALSAKTLARTLELLSTRKRVVRVDKDRRLFLSAEVFAALLERARSVLGADGQSAQGMAREELRQRVSDDLDSGTFARVLQALADAGEVEVLAERVSLSGLRPAASEEVEARKRGLVALLEGGGLAPPTGNELAARMGLPEGSVQALLKVALAEGLARRVGEDLYFHPRVLETLKGRLVEHLREHGEISTQKFKELVGQSRKYVIPLSEFFDREKVTLRVGEKRVLRKR